MESSERVLALQFPKLCLALTDTILEIIMCVNMPLFIESRDLRGGERTYSNKMRKERKRFVATITRLENLSFESNLDSIDEDNDNNSVSSAYL